MTRKDAGINERHAKSCPAKTVKARKAGAKCSCTPPLPKYIAEVHVARDNGRIRRSFRTKSEAKRWRAEAMVEVDKGTRRATSKTVSEALNELIAGMKDGSIRSRDRLPYKPATIRGYETQVKHWMPRIGTRRLGDLTPPELQQVVEDLSRDGAAPQTISNAINPLRVIYRRAIRTGEVGQDPTKGLDLPQLSGPRDKVVNEDEAAALIAALQERDQPIWATAFYAGLRVGELRALRWENVDPMGWINVEYSHDQITDVIHEPKTPSSRRRVPILNLLRPYIEQQWEAGPKTGEGFVFFRTSTRNKGTVNGTPKPCLRDGCEAAIAARGLCTAHYQAWRAAGQDPAELPPRWQFLHRAEPDFELPFHAVSVRDRAFAAWDAAKLERVTFHVCRHTFASVLFARRVKLHRIQQWMGHQNPSETIDTYTHLIPGTEEEDLALANAPLPKPVLTPRPRLQLGPASNDDE